MAQITLDNGASFTLPKAMLCKASPFFEKCLAGPFKEATSGRVDLSDVSFETFSNFVTWLSTADLRDIWDAGKTTKDIMAALVDLAVFGDRIQCDDLVNHIIFLTEGETFHVSHLVLVSKIYEHTCDNSLLRRYMALQVAWSTCKGNIRVGNLQN